MSTGPTRPEAHVRVPGLQGRAGTQRQLVNGSQRPCPCRASGRGSLAGALSWRGSQTPLLGSLAGAGRGANKRQRDAYFPGSKGDCRRVGDPSRPFPCPVGDSCVFFLPHWAPGSQGPEISPGEQLRGAGGAPGGLRKELTLKQQRGGTRAGSTEATPFCYTDGQGADPVGRGASPHLPSTGRGATCSERVSVQKHECNAVSEMKFSLKELNDWP